MQEDVEKLGDAVNICQTMGSAEMKNKYIAGSNQESINIDKINQRGSRHQGTQRSNWKQPSEGKQKKKQCPKCSYQHEYGKCPAWGKNCKKCGKINHFAKA